VGVLLLRGCEVDLDRRAVRRPDGTAALSEREVELLAYLSARPGQTVSRDQLLVDVWGFPEPVPTRAVDNTLMRLRTRVERDPKRPEHLVTVRGVGYCFVPLPVAPTPAAPGAFHGREAQWSAVVQALDSGQLVTLHGPGGVGKTRLALELIAARGGRMIQLGAADGRGRAMATVAAATGVALPLGGDDDAVSAQLARALARREPELLVLDELEGLLPAIARDIAGWLAASPALRVLVTSRRPVALPGEQVVRLGPLPHGDAAAMLRERAPVPVADGAELRALVEQLDGLPLAIELIAPRLAHLTAGDLRELIAGAGDGTGAAAERSWRLLDAQGRRALVALAAWPGRIAASDARWLCGDDGLARIEELCAAALLRPTGDGRFVMLESTRRHALQQEGALQAIARAADRLVAAASALAEAMGGPSGIAAAHSLDRLAPAVLAMARDRRGPAGLRGLLALGPLLLVRGPVDRTLPALLDELSAEGTPSEQSRASVLRGALAWLAGDRAAAEDALSAALAAESPDVRAEARARLGFLLAAGGHIDQGRAACSEAAKEAAAPSVEAFTLVRLGAIEHQAGRPREARRALRRALGLYQRAGNVREEARTLGNVALFDLERGRHDAARRALRRALESARREGSRLAAVSQTINLGGLAHLMGRLDEAEALLAAARDEAGGSGDLVSEAIARWGLGCVALERGDRDAARRELGRARRGFEDADHTVFLGGVLGWLAALEAVDDDPEEGRALLREAHRRSPPLAASFDALEAVVLCAEGQRAQADAHLAAAEAPARASSAVRQALRVSRVLVADYSA